MVELRNHSIVFFKVAFGRYIPEQEYFLFKNKLLKNMIYEIKCKGNKSSAYVLGVELRHLIKSSFSNFDLIIPIPVSKAKRQIRGFNQCELIAKGF